MTQSFKEIVAWQKAHAFVVMVYKTCASFPAYERHGLWSQFTRAAVSIAANIAEGYRKDGIADKLRFLNISQGSLEECRYYILLSYDLDYIDESKYNKVLNELYEEHIPHASDIIAAQVGKVSDGWCRELKTLLKINNIMADFNSMNNIIGIDFKLADYLVKRDTGVLEMDKTSRMFLSEVLKVNITSTRVTEYNYSIDMSKFNNANYTLIRDKENNVYLVVYLESGEFLEEELQDEINKLDVTDKLRLAYYNKYSKG
jgi:four helix bundle protein